MDATKVWTLAGLVFGLIGTALNAKADDFLIRRTGGWGGGMSERIMQTSRRWSWPGWACIGAAFVCGAIGQFVA